jgi:hypothetical protein
VNILCILPKVSVDGIVTSCNLVQVLNILFAINPVVAVVGSVTLVNDRQFINVLSKVVHAGEVTGKIQDTKE